MYSRSRQNIQPAVSFLTTIVKKVDNYDWGNLKQVIKFLKGTNHLKWSRIVDSISMIYWWVDESYNANVYCRRHTRYVVSLGCGVVTSISRKHKINVRILTGDELLGNDDAMGTIIWGK